VLKNHEPPEKTKEPLKKQKKTKRGKNQKGEKNQKRALCRTLNMTCFNGYMCACKGKKKQTPVYL
jgi:hypothetical protein